jgi:hypothetical protein
LASNNPHARPHATPAKDNQSSNAGFGLGCAEEEGLLMRTLIFAALFVAACASADPAAAPQQENAGSAQPSYQDARSTASDAEVRDARRAYRAACQQRHSEAYCECMTGGMAQALAPAELSVATAAFTGASVQATDAVRQRVAAERQDVDRGCQQFR